MTTSALLLPDSPASGRAARDAACADRQLEVLGRLAEAGLEIAVALEVQAKGGPAVVEGDIALAYNRVARAVRQTIMLQSRLIETQKGWAEAEAGRRAAARSGAARILRGAVEESSSDAERREGLSAEAAERLAEEDFADLLSRPFGEAVATICKDLGLSPDWLALAEDCAEAEASFLARPATASKTEAPSGPIEIRWLDDDDDSS